MTDIVERLRKPIVAGLRHPVDALHKQAADEIERLRAALDKIHILAGRQGPKNDIDALNQIEAAAAAALLHQQQTKMEQK